MADLLTVAGATIYIGGVMASLPEDFVAADFDAQDWTPIDGWETAGPVGDAAQEIATDLINRGRTVVQKGTKRAPASEMRFAIINGDAGQEALIAAEQTRNNYAFRIVWDDAPEGGTPSETLFIAIVMSTNEVGGGANATRMMSANLAINGNKVDVPAAPAVP